MPPAKKSKKKPKASRSLGGGDEAELAVGRLLGSRADPVNTLSEAGSVDKKAEGKSYYGYKTRLPYDGEDSYFKKNPGVAGMAAEDNRVVLNPYSKLKPDEMEQVAKNEGLRIYMRQSGGSLDFELTPEQSEMFKGTAYGEPANSEQAKRTIISRILTGDPSAGNATAIQKKWAEKVLAGASANEEGSHPSGGAEEFDPVEMAARDPSWTIPDPLDPTGKPWATDPPLPDSTEKPWAYGPGSDAPDPSPAPLAPISESDDPFLTKGDVAEAALSLASLAADAKRESRFKDFDVKQKKLGKKALGKALKFGAKPLSIALDAKEAFDLVTDPEARKEAREMTEQMSKESVGMRLLKSQADPANTLYGAGSALVEGGKARDRAKASELQHQKLAVVQKHMEDKYPRKKGVRRTLKEQLEMGAIRQKLLSDVAEVPRRRGGGSPARKFVFPDGTVEPFIKPK